MTILSKGPVQDTSRDFFLLSTAPARYIFHLRVHSGSTGCSLFSFDEKEGVFLSTLKGLHLLLCDLNSFPKIS